MLRWPPPACLHWRPPLRPTSIDDVAAAAGIFLTVTQATPVTLASFVRNLSSNPGAYLGGLAAGVTWGPSAV